MSSDTFHVEILSIEGDTAWLQCTTSTAIGVNDYAVTRSFALMALADGLGYGANTPLQQGIAAAGGQVWEEAFHQEHVGRFIAGTTLMRRIGIVLDEPEWRARRYANPEEPDEEASPRHKFVLRVQMTDPQYLEGLSEGSSWGSTAFDAWWNDPLRPGRAQMDEVEAAASLWAPGEGVSKPRSAAKKVPKKQGGAKKAAKKATKKTAAKKTAAKKTVKKTAAKQTAAKKTVKKTAAKKTVKKTAAKKATKKTAAKKAAKKTAAKKATKKTAAKKASARNG